MILEPGQTVSDWTTPPSYKAPEHIQRKPYSYPSDCWALGVLAYILLGGYKPFDTVEKDAPPLRTQILTGRVIFHEQEWKDVSDSAKDFIKKLLQPDEKSRMTAEQALMHPFLEQIRTTSAPNKTSPKRERKASIRQMNFVPPQRKSILVQTSSPQKTTTTTTPISSHFTDPGSLEFDNLMDSLGVSPTHSPSHSPRSSHVSPGEHVSLTDTLKQRRTSRNGFRKDKFIVGMEELMYCVIWSNFAMLCKNKNKQPKIVSVIKK